MTAAATTTAIVGVVAYSVVVARIEPFTRPSEVATGLGIVAIAALAVRTGWLRRGPIGPAPAPHGRHWNLAVGVWVLLIAAIGAFQLALFQSNPRETYPTLSSLASIAFAAWPARAAAIAAWIGLGIYLVVADPRTHRR
ncbi:MAG: hypothetical protein ACLFWR_12315 [Acidimicrobiales bacterium]